MLRLFKIDSKGSGRVADFLLGADESDRYVAVPPSDSSRYRFEYGFLMRSGKFLKICVSNEVEIPKIHSTDQTDSAESTTASSPIHDYLLHKISQPDFTEAYSEPYSAAGLDSAGSLDFIPKQ